MARRYTRIIQHPFAASLQGALLDSYAEDEHRNRLNLVLTIRALEHRAPSELFEVDGTLYERIEGNYVPIQVRFSRVSELKHGDILTTITNLSKNDSARTINDMLSWRRPTRRDIFYLFGMQAPKLDHLMFFADHMTYERLESESIPVTLERDWCPPPPMPHRLIPQPASLHRRFGGDPITLHIGPRPHHWRLFIGGLDVQPDQRPHVNAVLNVGEKPSQWVRDHRIVPQDRWENRGEGADGMSLDDMCEEAEWVIKHLKKNQRVLVHCSAGMNRSATICCAALILLEGITAEQALERVREHHPWARPDSRHWLKLRWLAKINSQ